MLKTITKKDLGLKAKEALALLEDSLKEEGFDEEIVRDFPKLVANGLNGKVTIYEKDIFKEKLKGLIKEHEGQLKQKDYRSPYKQLCGLFQDETKGTMGRLSEFLNYGNNWIILAIVVFIVLKIVFSFLLG